MTPEELLAWKEGVAEHCHHIQLLQNDRDIIIESMKTHLSQFFSWDKIKFSNDFTKIILYYAKDHGAVIDPDVHKDLGIPWIVTPYYDDKANRIIRVEIYPFGLPEEGEIVWE